MFIASSIFLYVSIQLSTEILHFKIFSGVTIALIFIFIADKQDFTYDNQVQHLQRKLISKRRTPCRIQIFKKLADIPDLGDFWGEKSNKKT